MERGGKPQFILVWKQEKGKKKRIVRMK